MISALFAAWMAFSFDPMADAQETVPGSPQFRKVLVLFSADTAKEDRDEFLAGLEEGKLQHRNASSPASGSSFYRNPHFLDVVDVQMVRTDRQNPFFTPSLTEPRLWDLESLPALTGGHNPAEAIIVVASDVISADLTRMIR